MALLLTYDDMVRINYRHYSGLFPRTCGACARVFASLKQYILDTVPLGATISYDAELADWKTSAPLDASALSNCPCGSTLGLTTEGIALPDIHLMLEWIRTETARRGVGQEVLLETVRQGVRSRALGD